MRNFRLAGIAHPEALVLGYGTPPAHAFTTAVTRLRAVLEDEAFHPLMSGSERVGRDGEDEKVHRS